MTWAFDKKRVRAFDIPRMVEHCRHAGTAYTSFRIFTDEEAPRSGKSAIYVDRHLRFVAKKIHSGNLQNVSTGKSIKRNEPGSN